MKYNFFTPFAMVFFIAVALALLFQIETNTRKQLDATCRIESRLIRAENERLDEFRRIARIDTLKTLTPK